MRHVIAVVRIAAAIISLWRHWHPISVGVTTAAMHRIIVAVATAATHTALVTPARPTVAARQQQAHDGSTLGHAKPYSSFIYWPNLLIFGHNTLHGHMHRLTSAFLICALRRYGLEIGKIFHIFPSGTKSMGDSGSKKAYTPARTGMYLHTKFGCDRSIVVGCRSRNDRQTYIHTDRQTSGVTIRPTLCETWRNKPYGHDASRIVNGKAYFQL